MELTLTTLIIGGLFTFLGGSTAAAIIVRIMDRRQTRIDTKGKEIKNLSDETDVTLALGKEIKGLVGQNAKFTSEIENSKMRIQALEHQIGDQKTWIADVYIKLGACEEREKQSQRQLSEMKRRQDVADDYKKINQELVEENLRIFGQLEKTGALS